MNLWWSPADITAGISGGIQDAALNESRELLGGSSALPGAPAQPQRVRGIFHPSAPIPPASSTALLILTCQTLEQERAISFCAFYRKRNKDVER